MELADKLSPKKLSIDKIVLDPDNPRFADLGDDTRLTAPSKIADAEVQRRTLSRLIDGEFDISELKRSIEKIGYVPIDKIVVRDLKNGCYVIVEGNRRIAAVKSLLQDIAEGKIQSFSEDKLKTLKEMDVLVFSGNDAQTSAREQWILQGLRHLSGVKSWGPYQQGRAVDAMMAEGFNEKATAQSLGMRVSTVTTLIRALRSWEQMKSLPDFEDLASPRLFSYFVELHKLSALRDWLEWSEEEAKFKQVERFQEFCSWIVETKDDEGTHPRRVARAIDLRELEHLVAHESAFTSFRAGKTVEQARALVPVDASSFTEWKESVAKATRAVTELPINVVEEMEDVDLELLIELRDLITKRLEQVEQVQAHHDGEHAAT